MGTEDAYRLFLAQHPSGKWAQDARIRIDSFALNATAVPPPTTGPAHAPIATSPAPVAPVGNAVSAYGIQLGAFSPNEKANSEWQGIAARFPTQLQGLRPIVVAVEAPLGRIFRLQAAVENEARARAVCDDLRKQSQGCVPVVPR